MERSVRLWRIAVAAASASLLLALAPTLAAASHLNGEPLGTTLFNRVIQRLCEIQQARGNRVPLADPARCAAFIPPTLTLVKTVVNDDGGMATTADFQAKIDGVNVPWGAAQTVAVGPHVASETTMPGYVGSAWGGDCASDGTIVLAGGENKTCTITNDDQAGRLIVDKVTTPSGSAAVFTVTATGTGAVSGGGTGTITDATSTEFIVSAGTYSVSESALAGWIQASSTCAGVVVGIGETKTCMIVNHRLPKLTVTKVVINDNGGTATTTDFQARIDALNVPWGVAQTVATGTHMVSETTRAGYAASAWGGDCAANGSITLSAGENKTCMITNDDQFARITVVKSVVNDNEGTATSSDFLIHVHDMSGTTTVDVAGSPQPGSGTGTTYTVLPGPYHIAETGGPANYSMSMGGDCASDGSITLAAGAVKTCIVTNNDNPSGGNGGGGGGGSTGKLLITEVLYDLSNSTTTPQGSEPKNEWVEIYNGTNALMNLGGFTLNDNNASSTIPNGTLLPSGKYLVVTGSTTTLGFWSIPGDATVVVLESGEIGNGLANGGDRVFLRGPTGIDVDAMSWGSNKSAFDPSVPVALDGYSIVRVSLTTDTDTAADWTQTITPTPGS